MSDSNEITSGAGASSSYPEITNQFSSNEIECTTMVPVSNSYGSSLSQYQRRHNPIYVGRGTIGDTGISDTRTPVPYNQSPKGLSTQRKAINCSRKLSGPGPGWNRLRRRRSDIIDIWLECEEVLAKNRCNTTGALEAACECLLFASDNVKSSAEKCSEGNLRVPDLRRSEIELIWYAPACDLCFEKLMAAHDEEIRHRRVTLGKWNSQSGLTCTGTEEDFDRDCACDFCDTGRPLVAMIHKAIKHKVDEIEILRPEFKDKTGVWGITTHTKELSINETSMSKPDGRQSVSDNSGMEIDGDI